MSQNMDPYSPQHGIMNVSEDMDPYGPKRMEP